MYNLLNIKTVAIKKGTNMKALLKKIKKTEQGFYKSLETNSMNIKTLNKIAEELEVTISELINDRPPKGKKYEHKNSLVSSPAAEYIIPENKEDLYKIMFEQQKEITEQQKEITEQQKEITELKLEVERLKNVNAPARDALAG